MKKVISLAVSLSPFVAMAATIFDIIDVIANVVSTLIPLLISIALLVFFYGVVKYIIAKGPEAKETAKDTMIYGIIGLFAIVAVWGLVALIKNTFGIYETTTDVPQYQF